MGGEVSIKQQFLSNLSARCIPGNYTVKIVHGMQDEKLTGLNDVGIRIEKQGE